MNVVIAVVVMVVSLVLVGWAMANSHKEREDLANAVADIGVALRDAVQPALKRCAETLNRLTGGRRNE